MGKMVSLKLSLLFILVASSAIAETRIIEAEWTCDTALLPDDLSPKYPQGFPRKAKYPIRVDFGPPLVVDAREFDDALGTARGSRFDYSSCLSDFNNRLYSRYDEECNSVKNVDSRNKCLALMRSARAQIEKRSIDLPPRTDRIKRQIPNGKLLPENDPAAKAQLSAQLEKLRKELSSGNKCYLSSHNESDWTALLSREFMNDHLAQAMKENPSQDCKKKILESYREKIQESTLSEQQCPTKTDPLCKYYRDSAAGALLQLARHQPSSSKKPLEDRESKAYFDAAECLREIDDPSVAFNMLSKDLLDSSDCVAPEVGETAVARTAHTGSNFALKREELNKYSARISLAFKPESKAAEMQKKINECFARANKLLKMPNGESLKLQFVTPTEAKKPPETPVHAAELKDPGAYPFDTSHLPDLTQSSDACPTLIHEMMHILGLIDEYDYAAHAKMPAPYNCSALGPPESLMRDADAAFARAEKKGEPLLYSGQWNAITRPGCKTFNKAYYQCADFIDQLSMKRTTCAQIPPHCRSPDWVKK